MPTSATTPSSGAPSVLSARTGATSPRWRRSPKGFLQALTLDHARGLLSDSASVLDASYEVGLSGPGRLHDLFVTHDAMTPGAFKARGEGIAVSYGFHPSPFGRALLMVTEHGLAGLAFADEGEEARVLADMRARWPRAVYSENPAATAPYVARIFDPETWRPDRPLRIFICLLYTSPSPRGRQKSR